MTVFCRRPLALATAVSMIFSFAAQRLGFPPALRFVWLASGILCTLAFFLVSFIKHDSRQALTGLALTGLLLFISYAASFIFFSSRIEPARRLASEYSPSSGKTLSLSGEVTRVYDGLIVLGKQNAAISLSGLDPVPSVSAGDILNVRISVDAGPELVGDSLRSQGVYFKGTASGLEVTGKAGPGLLQKIKNALTEPFDSLRTPGVAKAMTYGVRGGEEETIREALRDSGAAHLLSVSGLHVSLVLFAAVSLLKRAGAGPKARAAAVIAVAVVYVSILGFIPSALRAAIMTGAYYLSRALRRDDDPLTSLSLCAFAITTADPNAWMSSSFLLSFAAALGVIRVSMPLTEKITSSERFKSPNRVAAFFLACARDALCGVAVTVGAISFSLPVMMGLTRTLNALAPVANLVLGVLFPAVLAPLFIHSAAFCVLKLFGASFLAAPSALVCDLFLFVFEKTAVFFADICAPMVLRRPYTETAVFVSVCAILAAAAVLKLKPFKTAALGVSAVLVCVLINCFAPLICRGEIAMLQNGAGERAIVLGDGDRRVLVLDKDCRLAQGFDTFRESIDAGIFEAAVILADQDVETLYAASLLVKDEKLVVPAALTEKLGKKLAGAGIGFISAPEGEILALDGGTELCLSGNKLDVRIGRRKLSFRTGIDGAPEEFSSPFGAPDALLFVNCPSLYDPSGSTDGAMTVYAENGPEGADVFSGDGSFYRAGIPGGIYRS